MALLKQWRDMAYDEKANKGDIQRFWANYFNIEKGIYEQLLTDPDTEVKGTVKELAERFSGWYQRQPGRAEPHRGDGGGHRRIPEV